MPIFANDMWRSPCLYLCLCLRALRDRTKDLIQTSLQVSSNPEFWNDENQIEDLHQDRFASNELSKLARDLPQGSTQQGATGEDHDFLDKQEMVTMIDEMEKKERAQADELTTQAEEIIHLQDEVQEAAVTLEKRETELNMLRIQLQMLEKANREKKEEHSNLVASMTAVEEIWENENARAAQLKEVMAS